MIFSKKFMPLFLLFFLVSCASVDPVRIEEQGFKEGSLFRTVQTYELLVHENYELLILMDEEGDTGPSRHRNLIMGRLNSALYHLGSMVKSFDSKDKWSPAVIQYAGREAYIKNNRQFFSLLKDRWQREWKESFDDEDPEGYRLLAIETYLELGNAFNIKALATEVTEKKDRTEVISGPR